MSPLTERNRLLLGCLVLFLGTFFLFLPSIQHEFLNYDDDQYITECDLVKQGLTPKSAVSALVEPHFFMWHPVTTWSLQLDYSLFGLKPAGYHLVSDLIHSLNAILAFLLAWRLCNSMPTAFIIATLFAWHPLRVESVAWAAERKDVLSTCFWLLALLAYHAWHSLKSGSYQKLTYVATVLAMMSKPITITLPITFLLLDLWPLQRITIEPISGIWSRHKKVLLEKIPFLAMAALLALTTLQFQSQSTAIVSIDELPLTERLLNACAAYLGYLGKILFPIHLAVFYPPRAEAPVLPALISLGIFSAIGFFAWRQRAAKPYLLFGFLWFLITLLPVIGLLQSGRQTMADRYSYFSSLGITIAVVLLARDTLGQRFSARVARTITGMTTALLASLTFVQLSYWANSETLFRRALAVTSNNYIAHINLGATLANQGKLDEALPEYEAALEIRPSAELHYKLGTALLAAHQPKPAQTHLEKAVELKPDFAEAYFELALALTDQDQLDAATRHLQKALSLQPELQKRLQPPPEEPAKKATGTP